MSEEASSFRMIATLGFAGLVAGVSIVGVFEATKGTIAENKARQLQAAVFEVLPGAKDMEEVELGDRTVYAGKDGSGSLIGYAIPAEGAGFQDTIKILYGLDPKTRKTLGMYVLESKETPGLGDKIYKDPEFVAEFDGLVIDPLIEPVKKGEGTADNQVDCITGATISSKAIVKILNEANDATVGRE